MNDLSVEISEVLEEYNQKSKQVLEDITRKTARKTANRLNSVSPKSRGRSGYAGGWSVRNEGGFNGVKSTVYNRKAPGLAHLLEFGHDVKNQYGRAKRGKRRTRAISHIKPCENWCKVYYLDELKKGISGI